MNRYATLTALSAFTIALAGCSGKSVTVNGVLKMDGNPVEGATITFVTEDGKQSFSGQSDASGNFTLSGPNGPGAAPGNYKVLVVKAPKIPGAENAQPGSPEYMKVAEKMAKANVHKPGMVAPPKPAGKDINSELPVVYGSPTTTPLTAKIPSDQNPIVIDIKSKP